MADKEGTTMPEPGDRKAPRWVRSTWRPTPRMSAGYDGTRKDENGDSKVSVPGLIYGSQSWTRRDTLVDAGPSESARE